jgi:hypothetical protein
VTAALSPGESGHRTGKCVSVRVSEQSDGAAAAIDAADRRTGTADDVACCGRLANAGRPARPASAAAAWQGAFAWEGPAGRRAMGRAPGRSGAVRAVLSRLRAVSSRLRPPIRGPGTPPHVPVTLQNRHHSSATLGKSPVATIRVALAGSHPNGREGDVRGDTAGQGRGGRATAAEIGVSACHGAAPSCRPARVLGFRGRPERRTPVRRRTPHG